MGSHHSRWRVGADRRTEPVSPQRRRPGSPRSTFLLTLAAAYPRACSRALNLECNPLARPCPALMFCSGMQTHSRFSLPLPRRRPTRRSNPCPLSWAAVPAPLRDALRAPSGRTRSLPQLPPQIAVEASQAQATTNTVYNPQVPSSLNSGINPATPIPLKFHPGFPTQNANSVWTFNGTIPPKLVIGQLRRADPLPSSQQAAG